MSVKNVIKLLKSELEFSDSSIDKLKIFHDFLQPHSDHINNYKVNDFKNLKWVFRLSLGF